MAELRALFRGLNRTVGSACARAVGLINAELVRFQSLITAALSESEGPAIEVI